MKIHRWWLALVAALLTPWIGPHIDRYLPIGWVLLGAGDETPDLGFWVIAGVLLCLAYVAWVVLLSAPRAGLRPARPPRGSKETWGGPAFP